MVIHLTVTERQCRVCVLAEIFLVFRVNISTSLTFLFCSVLWVGRCHVLLTGSPELLMFLLCSIHPLASFLTLLFVLGLTLVCC